MGQVGFGCYRVSIRSKEHRAALLKALEYGCPLVDTSANYTNGDSEELVGSILSEHKNLNPLIVTKAGYIQGKNLRVIEELNNENKAIEDLVEINDDLKHSIHPDFLKNQLETSLKRINKSSVDTFLLHNPEYYFKQQDATQEEYYRRIKKAFTYLEEEVKLGRIKNYGISSNTFTLPLHKNDVTDLKKVLLAAKEVSANNHFKAIQFPFNLIEIGALEKLGEYGDESLIELATLNNLITMTNRPLNAFTNEKLVRLATYEWMTKTLDNNKAEEDFQHCMQLIEKKWNEVAASDEADGDEKFTDVTLIKQFKEIWNNLPSADSVEQVYHGHFFPFLARLWGGSGLSKDEAAPFFVLYEYSLLYARSNMTQKALAFKKQATMVGLLEGVADKPFSVELVEAYLNYGIDYVLVGMKRDHYVEEMKHLFK